MKPAFGLSLLLVLLCVACKNEDGNTPDPIEAPEGYTLIWNDEFDGNSIDPEHWTYETGDGTDYGLPAGWGNNELQLYTTDEANAAIVSDAGNSVLAITALEENDVYTSARLTTQDLLSIRFGRMAIRAKLPEGQGIWPAIWMLGDNVDEISWPGCGEIDIMELLGNEPDVKYSTLHYTNSENAHAEIQHRYELSEGRFSDTYHVLSVDWTPESLTFLLDEVELQSLPIEGDMKEFLRSFYLIMNVAVGGYWPGNPDGSTLFPQTLYVDYVRVFSKDGLEIPAAPDLILEEETIGQIIEPGIAQHAFNTTPALGALTVMAWGGGGEPDISTSETAVDGELSVAFDFPGGNWGGAYFELENAADISGYSTLKFSLNKPAALVNAEIKLETPSTNAVIFLENYTGTPTSDDFVEYSIPLADFAGLALNEITIPFALWNPLDVNGDFVTATVLVDNVHFSE